MAREYVSPTQRGRSHREIAALPQTGAERLWAQWANGTGPTTGDLVRYLLELEQRVIELERARPAGVEGAA